MKKPLEFRGKLLMFLTSASNDFASSFWDILRVESLLRLMFFFFPPRLMGRSMTSRSCRLTASFVDVLSGDGEGPDRSRKPEEGADGDCWICGWVIFWWWERHPCVGSSWGLRPSNPVSGTFRGSTSGLPWPQISKIFFSAPSATFGFLPVLLLWVILSIAADFQVEQGLDTFDASETLFGTETGLFWKQRPVNCLSKILPNFITALPLPKRPIVFKFWQLFWREIWITSINQQTGLFLKIKTGYLKELVYFKLNWFIFAQIV